MLERMVTLRAHGRRTAQLPHSKVRAAFAALAVPLAGLALIACAAGGATTSSNQGGSGEGGSKTGSGGAGDGATSTSSGPTTSSTTTSTASTTSSSGGGAGGSGTGGSATGGAGEGGSGTGGSGPSAILGDSCKSDAECVSGLCKPVLINSGEKVCVEPCTQNADCTVFGSAFFCEPVSAGSTDGYCVPQSPAHCLSCSVDADCGSLAEECFQAPGDKEAACHVDCSIAGEDACPPEYTCTELTVDGALRKLCRPNVPTCTDASGGYCDRVSIPQACDRENSAGICLGQRTCHPTLMRFSSCNAPAPQCKPSCSDQDPAGCTQEYCPSATSQPDNCGACGNQCPGLGKATAVVGCDAAQKCTFACKGENYDVNGATADGCEVLDGGVHDQADTKKLFDHDCDSDNKLDNKGLSGTIASDQRVHSPSIKNFNPATGAAPDWFQIRATGGTFCQNDIDVTFTVTGAKDATCYTATLITNEKTYTCKAGTLGTCKMTAGSASYNGGTAMYFKAEKTCSTTKAEKVSYKFTGHL